MKRPTLTQYYINLNKEEQNKNSKWFFVIIYSGIAKIKKKRAYQYPSKIKKKYGKIL